MNMSETYNRYNLEATFKKYLTAENISPQTIKQYLSDYRHFMNWVGFFISKSTPDKAISLNELDVLPYIEASTYDKYRQYLIASDTPSKTINRRLSTLRKLSGFCNTQGWIKGHPGESLTNLAATTHVEQKDSMEKLMADYAQTLQGTALHKKTELKTIEEFLSFINSN